MRAATEACLDVCEQTTEAENGLGPACPLTCVRRSIEETRAAAQASTSCIATKAGAHTLYQWHVLELACAPRVEFPIGEHDVACGAVVAAAVLHSGVVGVRGDSEDALAQLIERRQAERTCT